MNNDFKVAQSDRRFSSNLQYTHAAALQDKTERITNFEDLQSYLCIFFRACWKLNYAIYVYSKT